MNNKFIEYLKSDEKIFVCGVNKEKTFCVKLPYFIEGWEFLYFGDSASYYEKNLEVAGYYNSKDKKILNPTYSLRWKVGEKEIEKMSYNYSEIEKEMKEKILKRLFEKYENKEYTVPSKEVTERRNQSLNYQASENAKHMFLEGRDEIILEYSLSLTKEDLMSYLSNKEEAIENYTTKYFSDEEKVSYFIYMTLLRGKIAEELEKTKNEADNNGLNKLRILRTCIPTECKTVNITCLKKLEKEERKIEFTCKVDTRKFSFLESPKDWVASSWDINPVKLREEFISLFGRGADIRVPEVIKITYGKRVLYSEEEV